MRTFDYKVGQKITIKDIPLTEVFIRANEKKDSIVLSCKQGQEAKNIFIKDGEIVFANSNSKSDSLKNLLTVEKRLSENQIIVIEDYLSKNKTNFIDALVSLGYFPKDKIDDLKQKQVNHIVIECHGMLEGYAEIVKNDSIYSKIQHFQVPMPELTALGLSKYTPVESIKKVFPEIVPDNFFKLLPNAENEALISLIPPEVKGILTIIKSSPKIEEVLSASFLKEDQILKNMYYLCAFKIVEIEEADKRDTRLHEKNLTEDQKTLKQDIIDFYMSMGNKSYYEILDVLEDAPKNELDDALNALMIKYDPIKHAKLFSAKQKSIPDKIIAKLKEAHSILCDENKRSEYDIFVAKGEADKFTQKSATIGRDESKKAAIDALNRKDYDQAILHLNEALKHTPNDSDLMCELAGALFISKGIRDVSTLNKALSILKTAHSHNPSSHSVFIHFGRIFKHTNKIPQAIESYKKALLLSPLNEEAERELKILDPDNLINNKIKGLYRNLKKLNYYELLNTGEKSSSDEIKKAYHLVTKRFHPDRMFTSTEHELKEMTKAIYKKMVEAYMVLKNAQKRVEYDNQLGQYKAKKNLRLKDASLVVQKKEKTEVVFKSQQARKFFELGMTSFNLGKLNAAKINFQLAYQAEPDNILIKRKLREVIEKERQVND